MSFIEELSNTVSLPKIVKIRQTFKTKEEGPTREVLRAQLEQCPGFQKIKPGMRIAITSGSRGLDRYAEITRVVCDMVKEKGALPFIFPAMGSHGGATDEGQKIMLEHMNGISEETMGVPILSSMEVVEVGKNSDGRGIFIDRYSWESDGIILLNRIKAHTNFKGTWESGLMKMMAIGIGKQHGAEAYHKTGLQDLPRIVDEVGHAVLATGKILFGVATIDNGVNKVYKIETIDAPDIPKREAELLRESYTTFPANYWKQCDALIIEYIGKDISGSGADPNVTGRFATNYFSNDVHVTKIGILDITDKSDGNATGIGYGDLTTKRLAKKIDLESLYTNVVTNTVTKLGSIPLMLDSDRQVVCMSVRTSNVIDEANVRLCFIKNTKELNYIWVSENMVAEAIEKGCEVIGGPIDIPFDEEGNLLLDFSE